MFQFFRSIRFKIFGISVGLLLMMLGTTIWSALLTERVHRQLRTLEESIFPLAMSLSSLKTVVQSQKTTADYLTKTPDKTATTICQYVSIIPRDIKSSDRLPNIGDCNTASSPPKINPTG